MSYECIWSAITKTAKREYIDTLQSLFAYRFQPFEPQGDCGPCSGKYLYSDIIIETASQKELKKIYGAENLDFLSGTAGNFN